jgi:hypothetical protein
MATGDEVRRQRESLPSPTEWPAANEAAHSADACF